MDWREIYARRLCTPEQAAALIAPGDRIFAGGAGSFPAVLIDAVSDRAELRGIPVVTVVNGTESRALSDPACFARTPYHSLFLGRADRKFQQRGGLHENSVQFHQTVRAAREVYRVNTLMLEVSEPDADGYLYYGPRGTAWSSLDTQVEKRIYQVNAFQQRTRGEHHRIHVSEVTALCRADHPLNTYHYKAPDALDARIAAHILPLVRDGDTLQVGIGGIPNAVAYGLHGRKRLGIYTEVLTQAQLRLMASGAVDLDRVEASIVLDAAGHLDDFALAHIRMIPVDVLNDPFRAAQQPGLISVNGCLMADLTGQVCAEAIDGGSIPASAVSSILSAPRRVLSADGVFCACIPRTKRPTGRSRPTFARIFRPVQSSRRRAAMSCTSSRSGARPICTINRWRRASAP